MKFDSVNDLTDKNINGMSATDLIVNTELIFDEEDEVLRNHIISLFLIRAKEVKSKRLVEEQISIAKKASEELKTFDVPSTINGIVLDRTDKGAPKITIDNYLEIMLKDKTYDNVKYNLVKNNAEKHFFKNGIIEIRDWRDADEAESLRYIEKVYGIYSDKKHYSALRLLFQERQYNPIKDVIDNLVWDGVERCEHFLTKWAKADDTPYTREVSRLIFAGGINRVYHPGCKFDEVPVLVGTKQGEGKSSIIRWLAMNDKFFTDITQVEGQKAIEEISGKWICEFSEMQPMTKAKEQESIKAYITRQVDRYRKPFDRATTEYPRSCIFIGTTNHAQFLKDKTGNRRFYPVTVHSNGYDLSDHEQECRDYIMQCWAEAKAKFDKGEMPPYADRSLSDEYKQKQDEAMEDDWRVGVIEAFVEELDFNTLVCTKMIKKEALDADKPVSNDPTNMESREIGIILNKIECLEKLPSKKTVKGYGQQWCWRKKSNEVQTNKDLPF